VTEVSSDGPNIVSASPLSDRDHDFVRFDVVKFVRQKLTSPRHVL
jgi:hypothetical protein